MLETSMTDHVQLYARDITIGSLTVFVGMAFFIWFGLFLAYRPLTPEILTEAETYLSHELSSSETPVTITELSLKRDYWAMFWGGHSAHDVCIWHCSWSSETFYIARGKYVEAGTIKRLELHLNRYRSGPLYLDLDSSLNETFIQPNWLRVR